MENSGDSNIVSNNKKNSNYWWWDCWTNNCKLTSRITLMSERVCGVCFRLGIRIGHKSKI